MANEKLSKNNSKFRAPARPSLGAVGLTDTVHGNEAREIEGINSLVKNLMAKERKIKDSAGDTDDISDDVYGIDVMLSAASIVARDITRERALRGAATPRPMDLIDLINASHLIRVEGISFDDVHAGRFTDGNGSVAAPAVTPYFNFLASSLLLDMPDFAEKARKENMRRAINTAVLPSEIDMTWRIADAFVCARKVPDAYTGGGKGVEKAVVKKAQDIMTNMESLTSSFQEVLLDPKHEAFESLSSTIESYLALNNPEVTVRVMGLISAMSVNGLPEIYRKLEDLYLGGAEPDFYGHVLKSTNDGFIQRHRRLGRAHDLLTHFESADVFRESYPTTLPDEEDVAKKAAGIKKLSAKGSFDCKPEILDGADLPTPDSLQAGFLYDPDTFTIEAAYNNGVSTTVRFGVSINPEGKIFDWNILTSPDLMEEKKAVALAATETVIDHILGEIKPVANGWEKNGSGSNGKRAGNSHTRLKLDDKAPSPRRRDGEQPKNKMEVTVTRSARKTIDHLPPAERAEVARVMNNLSSGNVRREAVTGRYFVDVSSATVKLLTMEKTGDGSYRITDLKRR